MNITIQFPGKKSTYLKKKMTGIRPLEAFLWFFLWDHVPTVGYISSLKGTALDLGASGSRERTCGPDLAGVWAHHLNNFSVWFWNRFESILISVLPNLLELSIHKMLEEGLCDNALLGLEKWMYSIQLKNDINEDVFH